MTEKMLGFIEKASFGWGGYDDCMIGLSVTLKSGSSGVGDFKGAWGIDRSDYCQWSEEDRIKQLGEAAWLLRNLLKSAKKKNVNDLAGVPVEIEFEGNKLHSWRILEEVIS